MAFSGPRPPYKDENGKWHPMKYEVNKTSVVLMNIAVVLFLLLLIICGIGLIMKHN